MDIVYASLIRRGPSAPPRPGEAAEVIGALWAQAVPDDGLEHATARVEPDRIDLLLFLLSRIPDSPAALATPAAPSAVQRVGALLARCHQASPLLRRHFLTPGA